MTIAEPLVVGSRVRIAYDGFTAVDSADFTVRAGEKFVLIGPSGCGKTTLLKAIAGFLHPAAGTITLDGRPIEEPGPDRTVVFQDFDQLFPWRTVLDNVVYALGVAKHLRGAAARERAMAMLALVGIERAAGRYPHQLSGGMKQRGAIARALALEPRILLMDEPFGALDAITRSQLQLDLNAIWRKTGVTIVLVTHSIQEAVFLGHQVAVMGGSPARIVETVDTSRADDMDSPEFVRLSHHLRELLIAPEAQRAVVKAAVE
ncbi:MAG TPA: ABC transporter ATP-binding protein [Candidatus Acidoferrum sp.]|jgi:NitT/TauT family transport system ATP-binding protein|nr:ABC transporter ATP-binding protein [Candidatus Acidoferrum sp.]